MWPGGALEVDSPLIGRYNVSNLLAAIATAWGLGRDPVVFLTRLRGFKGEAKFSSWLYRITLNLCRDWIRR